MQRPTCERLRVRTPSDANTIFHAVHVGLLPMVSRRLDTEERRAIESGCVYVWEERGANSEATGLGIERWTDSIQWGPSRVRDEFLFYQERRPMQADSVDTASSDSDTTPHAGRRYFRRQTLIKQTYSVFVATPYGRRKWHLIAYFTQETLDHLFTIEDHPLYSQVARLQVPPAMYTCARSSRIRAPSNGPNQFHPYSDPSSPGSHKMLAPLAYLKTLPPPRRHVVDEMALMSFNADILPKTDFLRISG